MIQHDFKALERGAPTSPAAAAIYWKEQTRILSGASKISPTARQLECLGVIKRAIITNGISPTYREIGSKMRLLPGSVKVLVDALEERGHLCRIPGRQQSITLL